MEHASDYYQRALKIQLEQLGENHDDVAHSCFKLGVVCFKKDDLEEASDLFEWAMKSC